MTETDLEIRRQFTAPPEKVWRCFTDLMRAGWRPAKPMFGFTAVIAMTPKDGGTAYSARAMHQTPDGQKRHADMGFTEGWGAVADQLGRLAERI